MTRRARAASCVLALALAANFAPAVVVGAESGATSGVESGAPSGVTSAVGRPATDVSSAAPGASALAAGCTTCHQPGVRGIPALYGRSRETLRAELEGYRNGSLPGTVMPQLVRGYTPAELDLVAQWFATEPAPQ